MRRAFLIPLAIVVAVPVAAVGAAQWYLSGDALRARLAETVLHETGRTLTIAGPIHLAWSLTPTITVDDVAISNPPGFSRAAMAHVDRLEARIALAPLLSRRVEVTQLRLDGPDVLLERDAAGHPNWTLSPPAAAPSSEPAAPSAPGPRFTVAVGAVRIDNARFAFRADPAVTILAPSLAYDPQSGLVSGALSEAGQSLALSGRAGPIEGDAWPLDLMLTGAGLKAQLSGSAADATLALSADDLAAASPLVGRALPSIRDVRLTGHLSAAGLSGLQLDTGAWPLGAMIVENAHLAAPALSAPAEIRLAAKVGALPIALTAQAGTLAGVLGGSPVPFTAHATAASADANATGTIALHGPSALRVSFAAPDLAALAALSGRALPPLHDLRGDGQFTISADSVAVHALRLAAGDSDLTGDLAVTRGDRPMLRGVLTSTKLDLDALTAIPVAVVAPPAPPIAPSPAQAPGTSPPAPAAGPRRVIPDTPLDFAALRRADADLQLTVVEAVWHGRSFRVLQTHAVLAGGKLVLDPLGATIGEAPVKARLSVDAAATPPALALDLDGANLPVGPTLALLGGPADSAGTLDLHAALHASGDTPRAIAASLDGYAGLAAVDGEIDNAWLEALFADALRAAHIPLEANGTSKLRCLALRADAKAGTLQFPALVLDTSKLLLTGEGSVALGDETVDLHLRPLVRLGAALAVPLRIRGTLAAPRPTLDTGALAPGRVGITIGGPAPADPCGPALAAARNGDSGPAPAQAPAPPPRAPRPADLLRGLLR